MGMILPEQILNNLTDGITVQDTNFKIIYQNKIMADTFGKQVGEYCYQVYEKRNKICEGCGIQRAFLTGEKNMTIRVAKGINKESSYWENSCFPLFDDRGNIMAGVEVCRDVTDRVTLEEEVKERNIKLSQVNNELIQKSEQLQKSLYERNLIEEKLRYEIETRLDTEKELRYCQLDCVKFFSANFLRKGRFLGTCPMGFFLQLTSIFTQTKASSV